MKIVNCDCGESYWVNENGWPAMCRCGKKLEQRPLIAEEAALSSPFSEGLEGQEKEASCWDLSVGVWFESEVSGAWYHNEKAAGEILAVKINGVLYRKAA